MSFLIDKFRAGIAAVVLVPGLHAVADTGPPVASAAAVPEIVIEPPGPAAPATVMAPHIARQAGAGLLGMQSVSAEQLATQRGGTDVFNDMQLKGVVTNNQAVNVGTGSNGITEGAFANSAGLPMVVQNTGNNVLIQNATIVNVQLK